MMKLNLNDAEVAEFKDLLYTCVEIQSPIINSGIAEAVLRQIEEDG